MSYRERGNNVERRPSFWPRSTLLADPRDGDWLLHLVSYQSVPVSVILSPHLRERVQKPQPRKMSVMGVPPPLPHHRKRPAKKLKVNRKKLAEKGGTPPPLTDDQSINVYCPNLAFIQLTTRRRRLLVTLDQLHTILQSTGFTTGCQPNQVLFTMISLVLLGCVHRCPFWPHSSPSLSALRFPIRLLSFLQGGFFSVRRHAS